MAENTENTQQQKLNTNGLALVLLRNAFYRDNYRHAVVALLIICCIDVLLLFAIIYRVMNPPQPQYFATNSQYQLIKYHPLTDPVVDNNYVLQWVTDAVRQAFSLDYIHWRGQLQRASNNFTPSGWHWFVQKFQQSGDLDTLVKLKMVSSATVTGAPSITYSGVLDGRFVWKVQLPILITYSSAAKVIPLPLQVTLIVIRVPVQDNPDQIAINQFLPIVQGNA